MIFEEFQAGLNTLVKGLPASGFDSVPDNTINELLKFADEADEAEMKSGKKLVSNLANALKTRKLGGNTDESVQVRLVALDFYLKNLQSGATEDL